MDLNPNVRTAAKWLCVEAVILALWWFGPGNDHQDVTYKITMFGVMHTYLFALIPMRGSDPCHRWWRGRGEERADTPSS